MTGPLLARAAMAACLAAPCLVTACRDTGEAPRPSERSTALPFILEEVLRYEIAQFAGEESPAAGATTCVAVRDGRETRDPNAATLRRLPKSGRFQPWSSCRGDEALTLIAGPVEWRADDEVYASGAYLRPGRGETPLKYRVLWEQGRWRCAGPIVVGLPL
jgi:hypothetical protein